MACSASSAAAALATAFSRAFSRGSSDSIASSGILLPRSSMLSCVCFTRDFAENTSSFFSLRASSASQLSSASCMTLSTVISPRSCVPVTVTLCCRRVAQSFAETERIPSLSISKVTSSLGMPAGAGGRPSSLKDSSCLLSAAMGRSPCSTTTSMESCASSVVVNSRVPFVGIAVLRSITGVKTPPLVSTPSVNGVTSMSIMSCTSPAIMAAWTAAPMATTSSGLMALFTGL
mmetsp:Transcript_124504/g.363545  ORF Transcript_124504/g.363545 Transcript_124504/m.363545 type:complete len:232 (-) Transcript_124504:1170-1865(-)